MITALQILQAEAIAIRQAEDAIFSDSFQRLCMALSSLRRLGKKAVVSGVGKSAIVARKIAATMATVCIPAVFIDPIGLYHGELGTVIENDIVLLVSHSGKTEELLRLLIPLRTIGARVYSLVSWGDSPLGLLDNAIITGVRAEAYLMIPTASSAAAIAVGDAAACRAAQIAGHDVDHLAVVHPGGDIGQRLR